MFFDRILRLIAPHYCLDCQQIGYVLCDDCLQNIIKPTFDQCLFCSKTSQNDNLCPTHATKYLNLWCVNRRQTTLKQLIDNYKFHSHLQAAEVLAELLNLRLPKLSKNTVILPIPTTAKNIRSRSYDHMLIIAKILAKKRHLPISRALKRQNNITQHLTKNAKQRIEQSKTFFRVQGKIQPDLDYLIIDDVFTTGATIDAAKQALEEAGAKNIRVAVIARQ